MKTQYTPGPWKATKNTAYWQIDSEHDGQIGDACISQFIEGNTDGGEANAKLMSAAPELLEAAQNALENCVDLIGTDEGKALEAAIKKALGEV